MFTESINICPPIETTLVINMSMSKRQLPVMLVHLTACCLNLLTMMCSCFVLAELLTLELSSALLGESTNIEPHFSEQWQ